MTDLGWELRLLLVFLLLVLGHGPSVNTQVVSIPTGGSTPSFHVGQLQERLIFSGYLKPCCQSTAAFQVPAQCIAATSAAVCSTSSSSSSSRGTRYPWGCPWHRSSIIITRGSNFSSLSTTSSTSSSTAARGIPHFYRWLCNQFPSCVQPLHKFVWPRASRQEQSKAKLPRGGSRNRSSSDSNGGCNSSSGSNGSFSKDMAREQMLQQLLKEEKLLIQQYEGGDVEAPKTAASSFSVLQRNQEALQQQRQKQQEVPIDALLLDFNALLHLSIHGHMPSLLPPASVLQQQQQQQQQQPLLLKQHLPLLLRRVLNYLDLIVKLVRPRVLLCITLDGVPPIAKLAQQRGRRFRHQKELQLQQQQQQQPQLQQQVDAAAAAAGVSPPSGAGPAAVAAAVSSAPSSSSSSSAAAAAEAAAAAGGDPFDINSIGPGTRFMFLAEGALKRFIAHKQKSSRVWGCMRAVIFSGADMPGEGEHKLMQLLSRGFWGPPSAAIAEAWSSEVQQQQQQAYKQMRRRGGMGLRLLLPPSFEATERTPKAGSFAAAAAAGAAATTPNQLAQKTPSQQQQHQQQQQKDEQQLLAVPGRICVYGLDADLLVLALARHRPGLLILREKQNSLRNTRAATAKQMIRRLSTALQQPQQPQQQQQEQVRQRNDREETAVDEKLKQQKQKPQRQQEGEQQKFEGLLLPSSGDFLRYTARDFEVVCIDTLRRQLVRSLATAAANEAAAAATTATAADSAAKGASTPGLRKLAGSFLGAGGLLESTSLFGVPGALRGLEAHRLIDDFVLLSFFVGNDFLPALPHINIFQGGLSALLQAYTQSLPLLGGYLTKKTQIHLPRLIHFFSIIAQQEKQHFQAADNAGPLASYALEYYASKFPLHQLAAAEALYEGPKEGSGAPERRGSSEGTVPPNSSVLAAAPFGAFRYQLCMRYISGLFFLLHYYHSSTPSWSWSFPYHYAPLASDLGALGAPNTLKITLPHSLPISPYLQLLAVLPPSSSHLLPTPYRGLHTAPNNQMIKDLFPSTFLVDPYPLHAVPYPQKAAELELPAAASARSVAEAEGINDLASSAAIQRAMQQGRAALAKALEKEPSADKAAQLPEWLHRPLIPFLDISRLRAAAAKAVQDFRQEDMARSDGRGGTQGPRPEPGGPWVPEDLLRNRLGRPHVFLSPQLQAQARETNRRKTEGRGRLAGARKGR